MFNTNVCMLMPMFFVLRVVHVFGTREGFERPVEETVEEDEASTHCPYYQDSDEVHSQVIDHLHGDIIKHTETLILAKYFISVLSLT